MAEPTGNAVQDNPEEAGRKGGLANFKLTDEIIRKAQDYYDNEATDKPIKDAGGNITGHEVNLPTKEGLALWLNVARRTLYYWADDSAEAMEGLDDEQKELKRRFLHIFDKIMAEQGKRLINKGLAGKYNPLIGKLLLHKHGYKDMSDLTSGDQPVSAVEFAITKERTATTDAAKEAQATTAKANETKTGGDAGAGAQPGRPAKSGS